MPMLKVMMMVMMMMMMMMMMMVMMMMMMMMPLVLVIAAAAAAAVAVDGKLLLQCDSRMRSSSSDCFAETPQLPHQTHRIQRRLQARYLARRICASVRILRDGLKGMGVAEGLEGREGGRGERKGVGGIVGGWGRRAKHLSEDTGAVILIASDKQLRE